MAGLRRGRVVAVGEARAGLMRARVEIAGGEIDAAGFPAMLGPVRAGDHVVVNTTGIELGLGTGGVGFILWNLDSAFEREPGDGHIVKLRYTPWQSEVTCVEAPESPHHAALVDVDTIGGMPVVACSLHSQVAAVAAGVKAARPGARVGYLMTDGAALPLAWSDLVARLAGARLVDATCTAGHAFGGDLESVNVFSGLAALRVVRGCDVVVAAMGPGVVGTGTRLGFTGLEQGQVLDAARALGGRAIACLRLSFAETRARHAGVSHHSIGALRIAARERATVVVPRLPADRARAVVARLAETGVADRHEVVVADGAAGLALLREREVEVTSMGRTVDEVPELFLAGAAAGAVAAEAL